LEIAGVDLVELISHSPVLLAALIASLPGPLQVMDVSLGAPEFLQGVDKGLRGRALSLDQCRRHHLCIVTSSSL